MWITILRIEQNADLLDNVLLRSRSVLFIRRDMLFLLLH